jgi:hypothetical protein
MRVVEEANGGFNDSGHRGGEVTGWGRERDV